MCGIFGAVMRDTPLRHGQRGKQLVEKLFLLSESRGMEAAGIAFALDEVLTIHKSPTTAKKMIRTDKYRALTRDIFDGPESQASGELAFIGHSRLVTDGERDVHNNNQPVLAQGIVGVHNGIVVNDDALWEENPALERKYEVDSEVIFTLLRSHLEHGESLSTATELTFSSLEGAASIAALFDDVDRLLLATNNGSLYYRVAAGLFVFASERYIVDQVARVVPEMKSEGTVHVRPGQAAIVDMNTLGVDHFRFGSANGVAHPARDKRRQVIDQTCDDEVRTQLAPIRRTVDIDSLHERFPYVSMRDRLRRCTRCILPETMPFVDFDEHGVCSYCRNYRPIRVAEIGELEKLVAPYRRSDGSPDCIVGVSGGRDSTYGLHCLKRELGMNPIAYTYDWGMVTDLARRNVSRICGKLGVEHVLVSADIPLKRENVRKNVAAWLARPTLGTIPLFMAGDKAYFYFLDKMRKQVGVELSFLCENLLERTDFKTGFAGVRPAHDDSHVYTLPVSSKLRLLGFFGSEFVRNPGYFNRSLADSAKAFAYYYLMDRDYHNLYSYTHWDEATVESTLLGEYGFELAEDTQTTWRIGDGTAAFYNYIYYAIAGMSENDTFRSNQIREGVITRDQALEHIDRENRPRFPSIQWYLDTIGLDRPLEDVLSTIESAPKRYSID